MNATVNAELQRIDHLLSTYLEDSELSRFNRNGSAQWITVSTDFVDLSAIAKGYAVDQVALSLEKLGIMEYLVEVGCELRAKGHNLADCNGLLGWNAQT